MTEPSLFDIEPEVVSKPLSGVAVRAAQVILPDPIIIEHEGIFVVRDDMLLGGTKRRAMHALFNAHDEYVYASPVYGYAQVALAYAARDYGKHATIFCAARKTYAPLTLEAVKAGAKIILISSLH